MRTNTIVRRLILSTIILVGASVAVANAQSWTDWTSAPTSSSVLGTLSGIDVTYTGPYGFAQTSGGGTNFWTFPGPASPYDGLNGPPNSDIIALDLHGTKTITFSQAVTNPYFAWTSWNGNSGQFGVPISILSSAQGFWGSGTPVLNPDGTSFNAVGEETGVIQLSGTFTSIMFSDSADEFWHGFTVGLPGVSGVPEPTTVLLLGLGLVGLAGARRIRS